jgi:DNA repair exonuclease SbcCD ATPase subunit
MSDISLRDYVDRIFDEKHDALEIRFRLLSQAVELGDRKLEKWQGEHNQFQHRMDKLAENFATKDQLNEKVRPLESFRSNLEGRMWAIGVMFTLINIGISLWFNK